jgi:DNA-binding MarR family transcriptional regulator
MSEATVERTTPRSGSANKDRPPAADPEADSVQAQLGEIEARLARLESTASRWKDWPTRLHGAQRQLAARRQRDALFGEALFGEPGWDVLLELYCAGIQHTRSSLSKVGGGGLPPTTVLRWIRKLEEEGLVHREADPSDRRRVFVILTDKAFDLMSAHLDSLAAAERELDVRDD